MSLVHGKPKKLALVVDDSIVQCNMLDVLLKDQGYDVVIANDGEQGVKQYVKHQPDLVLMDINMPVMNGYEAAREIKRLSKATLAPLIFITSLDSDESFVEAIEAGGDGILVRPFSPEVFKAKIKSIQRLSDLYHQVKSLQQDQIKDTQIAEQLFSDVIESKNFATDKIKILKKSAEIFCGDIQLSAQCPNGNVHVLLGDFTGHGLRSSIGAIPLAETFRTMSKKGFDLFEIIKQINSLLNDMLPADIFLAACFVNISVHDKSAFIFNAGLPDAYVANDKGDIIHTMPSCHPPIGVMPNLIPSVNPIILPINQTDHIVLYTDGVIEANNKKGEMFGSERLISAIKQGVISEQITEIIDRKLSVFCQHGAQRDDITVIDIPCDWEPSQARIFFDKSSISSQYIIADSISNLSGNTTPSWRWKIELMGDKLRHHNPIPTAMSYVQDIEGSGEHWQNLYTILTELYINALDHGVLGLDSQIKNSDEGFIRYFKQREQRLSSLTDGFVKIQLSYFMLRNGGRILISVKDSGNGFDTYQFFKNKYNKPVSTDEFSGRGIQLIDQLCDTVEYSENGTLVEVSYVW